MRLDENDTRGWVMSGVSGVGMFIRAFCPRCSRVDANNPPANYPACIIGAGIICVDLVIRSCCGFKRFDITTNSTFLSSSMGLSAGVMVSSQNAIDMCSRLF